MNSLEFTAKIERGVIHLPKEFEDYENEVAHVVVTLETIEESKTKKEKLFAAFKKAQKANLFKDIEDPVEWQRKLRDEWD
jgi:predicted  nucleic acid-binding Zn-ribbon protein